MCSYCLSVHSAAVRLQREAFPYTCYCAIPVIIWSATYSHRRSVELPNRHFDVIHGDDVDKDDERA